jgi:glutathione S-transferase
VPETEPHARATAPYLLGANFTVGDLNLAATLREPGEEGIPGLAAIDLAPFPNVAGRLDRCSARPANRRVAALVERPGHDMKKSLGFFS